jgi:hypothetical protein
MTLLGKDGPRGLGRVMPGFNFINILQEAFKCADPKSTKNTDDLTVFFYTFGI